MELFNEVKALGIPYSSYATDLYLPDTKQVRDLLEKHGLKGSRFHNNVEGGIWIDVPFAYLPGWPGK